MLDEPTQVPSPLRSKSSSNMKNVEPVATDSAQGESGAQTSPVDWLAVELPPGWERRVHGATGRHVYVHHESRKTQWYHPLDRSRAQAKRAHQGSPQREQATKEKLNRTDGAASRKTTLDEPAASEMAPFARTLPPSVDASQSREDHSGSRADSKRSSPRSETPIDGTSATKIGHIRVGSGGVDRERDEPTTSDSKSLL